LSIAVVSEIVEVSWVPRLALTMPVSRENSGAASNSGGSRPGQVFYPIDEATRERYFPDKGNIGSRFTKMAIAVKGGFLLNALVATTCVFTCAEAVKTLVAPRLANSPGVRAAKGPRVGSRFLVGGIDWARSPVNVLLAVSRGCHYCTSSIPFYQRLFDAASLAGVPVVLVTQDSDLEKTQEYFEASNLRASSLRHISFAEAEIKATPTVLIVDADGTIRRAWVGVLRDGEERDAIALVSARGPKSGRGAGPR
jgi:hypothetical protein